MGNCGKSNQFGKPFFISGGNERDETEYFYSNMMIKLFSLFKHEEKHLYCHNSEKHIDNYRIYEMVWLPKYCPEFLDSKLKKVYHNLPTIIKEQKTFLTDFQKSVGKKNKINKLIF